jgi:hypothetical protein
MRYSFHQHGVEMQQSGRLQNDGGAENACRAHEEGAQTGEDTIRGAQIGRTLAAAIEDQQLMVSRAPTRQPRNGGLLAVLAGVR